MTRLETWANALRKARTPAQWLGIVGGVLWWLAIGAFAADQRHYFNDPNPSCAHAGTTAIAILAGPLDYVGANPRVHHCRPLPIPGDG